MSPRIVVAGVSGSGKSTVGRSLAEHLGLPFRDGDDLHSEANVAKMAAGVPLDDADRLPWLLAVGNWLTAQPRGGVIACSALKRRYRDLIRSTCPDAWFAQLAGDRDLIRARQAARTDHFMPASLMDSQFETFEQLESGEAGRQVDVSRTIEQMVGDITDYGEHMVDFNAAVIEEFRANAGVVRENGGFADMLVLVHSTGARSGAERVNPAVGLRDGERWLVAASAAGAPKDPDWAFNLRANPQAAIEHPGADGVETTPVDAVELTGADREAGWARFLAQSPAFQDYENRAEGRTIPVFALAPRTLT